MRQFNAKYILGDWEAAQSAAGTTSATATTLKADHNWVATVTDAANGVILKAAPPGSVLSAVNADAGQAMNVYPWSGANFNGATADLPVTLPPNTSALFFVHSNTKIAAFF
jgi:hypothetical protein